MDWGGLFIYLSLENLIKTIPPRKNRQR